MKLSENNIFQTLSGLMGTGGNNTPMVLECFSQDSYDRYSETGSAGARKRDGGNYRGDQKH